LLINFLMTANLYVVAAIASAFVATWGLGSLSRAIRREKQTIHNQGGGI
jgi:sulfate permease